MDWQTVSFAFGSVIFLALLLMGIAHLTDSPGSGNATRADELRRKIDAMFAGVCSTPEGMAEHADELVGLIDEWNVLTHGRPDIAMHMRIKLFEMEWRGAMLGKEVCEIAGTLAKAAYVNGIRNGRA